MSDESNNKPGCGTYVAGALALTIVMALALVTLFFVWPQLFGHPVKP